MTLDGAQRRFEGTSALDRIAAVANVPIYIQSEANFGRGVMGGHLWSSLPWGLKSSEMICPAAQRRAAEHHSAKQGGDLQRPIGLAADAALEHRQRRIPAGTQILFREPSIWEEYRAYILGAIALMLLQSALIGGLLVQRMRRRRIEASLRESERRYRVTAEQNQDLSGRLINAQEGRAGTNRS